MATSKKSKLPDKPSELIRVALKDLAVVEKDERYVVDMGSWHERRRSRCAVCFAGAVMAGTLGASHSKSITPGDFDGVTAMKLAALDSIRTGWVRHGLDTMGVFIGPPQDRSIYRFDRDITPYAISKNSFKADMRALADDLEKAGL